MRTRTAPRTTALTASAQSIARALYNQGLEDEDLFAAMWTWHDDTGIEPRDIYQEYKTITTPSCGGASGRRTRPRR